MPKSFKLSSLLFAIFTFFYLLTPTLAHEPTFSDVNSEDPYFTEVEYLAAKDIINGHPDGTFLPLSEIKRGELIKLMVAMQGIDPDPEVYKDCFTDLTTEWFARYACYAKEKGWVKGYEEDGSFRAGNEVSGSESLKIILNPLFAKEIGAQTPEEIQAGIENLYDVEIEDWFAPYAAFAMRKGIIFYGSGFVEGKGDGFATYYPPRGRMAQVIFRALLVSEGNMNVYHDYYADKTLREAGFEDLVMNPSGCYRLDELEFDGYSDYLDSLNESLEFDFYSNYLESEYGIKKPYQSTEALYYLHFQEDPYYSEYFSEEDLAVNFPLFDPGYFCDLGDDGFLFSNTIVMGESKVDNHLIFFDKEGILKKDNAADCSEWIEFAEALDPRDLEGANLKSLEWMDCLYLKDKENVYIFEEGKIEGADAATFEQLRLPYSKDADQAFYIGELIEGADAATFSTFEEEEPPEDDLPLVHYAKDKAHVFYEKEIMGGADPATFEILQNGFSRDATHVFLNEIWMKHYDATTFEMIDKNYTADKNGVYYSYGSTWDYDSPQVIQLIGANSETLQILKGGYAVDGSKVYYQGTLMPEADGPSFQILESSLNGLYYLNTIAFDKNTIYEEGEIASWFDAETMEIINPFFIKQNGAIHFNFSNGYLQPITSEVKTLTSEDFTNFTILEDAPIFPAMWAKSDNNVYLMPVHLIEVTDASTFEFINQVYSKDSKNVFHLEESGYEWQFFDIKGADPNTFEPLAGDDSEYSHFGKDTTHVYYKLETLDTKALDVDTAKLIEEKGVIKDSKGYTCTIDEASFSVLSCG